MAAKSTNFDEYLAAVGADQRAALEKLRKSIHAIVPNAEECINYGVPAFRLNGKCVAGFGASANHCSYYPMSGATLAAHQGDLKDYETSKGAIHFPADQPFPMILLRKLIKTRMAEVDGKPEESLHDRVECA